MLHTVISTPRSGSNTLCNYLAKKFGADNLFEPVTDSKDADGNVDVERVIYNVLEQSKHTDVIAKFHVGQLLTLYPTKVDVINELLQTSRLCYSFRNSFSEQVKSIYAIEETNVCDVRFEKHDFTIPSDRAFGISASLVSHISIMGEWFKQFPGKLIVLEDMADAYAKSGFNKYADVYTFDYDSEFTRKFVERDINLKDYFEVGNPLYRLI